MSKTTEVNSKYLASLEKAAKKLQALENGGVDNWEFYSESLQSFYKEEEQEETLNQAVIDLLEFICSEGDIYEPAGRGCGYTIDLCDESNEGLKRVIRRIINSYNTAGE